MRQLYRKLDTTQEWVENNYYHLPIEQQTAELVTVSAFWRDYADHQPGGDTPYRSDGFAEASRNFPEMMLALAVLDLPFTAQEHQTTFEQAEMTLTGGSPLIVFHEEIKPVEPSDAPAPILVSQNFFRHGDRYRYENNERLDRYITDEFLVHVVYPLLARRHAYNHTLWSYGIKHNRPAAVGQYLLHTDDFVRQCGDCVDSPLLTIDPVERKAYQHMDYRPLVNVRAHQLGARRQILNDRFHAQYQRLLKILSYRRQLDDDDLMAVTYYLLLQDRVEDALRFFAQVDVKQLDTHLQYDYYTAYLAFYLEQPQRARELVGRYANYPVDRWREAFAAIAAQLDEIQGQATAVVDAEDRSQVQTELAASEASFEFRVESKRVTLDYQNLDTVHVNYYLMDIELLFSRNPFVQQYSGQFSHIRPNLTQTVKLAADATTHQFDLPEQLHSSNVLVEISGGGQIKSEAYYSNSLSVQVTENYGQLCVTHCCPVNRLDVRGPDAIRDT